MNVRRTHTFITSRSYCLPPFLFPNYHLLIPKLLQYPHLSGNKPLTFTPLHHYNRFIKYHHHHLTSYISLQIHISSNHFMPPFLAPHWTTKLFFKFLYHLCLDVINIKLILKTSNNTLFNILFQIFTL